MKIILRNTAGEIFSMDVNSEDTFEVFKNGLQMGNGNNIDVSHMHYTMGHRITRWDSTKCLARTSELNPSTNQIKEDESQSFAQSSEFLKCLVPECGLFQKENPEKHFFSLPTNKERLHHWLLVCRRPDLIENLSHTSQEHYGVCEDHFIDDNFVDNTKSLLKSEAIPTMFISKHCALLRGDGCYNDDDDDDCKVSDVEIKEECLSNLSDCAALEENDYENINQLCRLCASRINDVVYIFNDTGQEQQIAKKINSCLPITVKSTDPLPKQLCMSCVTKLNLCHEFAESCIEAEDKLLRLNRKNFFKSYPVYVKNENCPSLNQFSENSDKMCHSSVQNNSVLKDGLCNETAQESYGCPLCFGGSMSIKTCPKTFIVASDLDSYENSENMSYCSAVIDDLSNNDHQDGCGLSQDCSTETVVCEKIFEDIEEYKDKDSMSGILNGGVNKQRTVKLNCRICGDDFENLELCVSHAESHFDSGFYPCNLCDLCFTTLTSFKEHCEKQHIGRAKLKSRGTKRLNCKLCGKRFNSERTLAGHACGSSSRPYRCDECGKSFLTEVRLIFHQQIHQGGSAITCEHCGKMFSRENSLYDHVRLVHLGEKAHCCDQCGKTFQLKARLIAHQRVHTGERPFECDICGGKFYDKATLKGHSLTHLDVKPFQCDKCGRCFARKTLFKQHTIAHLSEERKRPRTYSCRLCGGTVFSSYAKLVEHRKDVHPHAEMNEVDDNAHASKPFKCEDCGKSFAYRVTLVAHRRNHTGELPFECDFCSKRFSQKRSLILHRRIHTGEKPFVCLECGKRFVQSAHLYSHTRLHTGEKPYSCEVCGESFRLKDVRDAHQRKHTGERPFKCSVCSKAFRTSHSYYQHMWIHQGKKPYPCSYCGKAFRRSNGLKIHIRIHTGEKPHSCDICGRSFAQKQDMKKHRNLHVTGKL